MIARQSDSSHSVFLISFTAFLRHVAEFLHRLLLCKTRCWEYLHKCKQLCLVHPLAFVMISRLVRLIIRIVRLDQIVLFVQILLHQRINGRVSSNSLIRQFMLTAANGTVDIALDGIELAVLYLLNKTYMLELAGFNIDKEYNVARLWNILIQIRSACSNFLHFLDKI